MRQPNRWVAWRLGGWVGMWGWKEKVTGGKLLQGRVLSLGFWDLGFGFWVLGVGV